jgi:hypothetical protein
MPTAVDAASFATVKSNACSGFAAAETPAESVELVAFA